MLLPMELQEVAGFILSKSAEYRFEGRSGSILRSTGSSGLSNSFSRLIRRFPLAVWGLWNGNGREKQNGNVMVRMDRSHAALTVSVPSASSANPTVVEDLDAIPEQPYFLFLHESQLRTKLKIRIFDTGVEYPYTVSPNRFAFAFRLFREKFC
jgi:hypothetical protein